MAWVRIDESFTEHPKVLAAGADAAWLFVAGLCYCNRNRTNGFIPAAALSLLSVSRKARALAATLVDVNLWEAADGGWEVHDYLHYQPSRADISETDTRRYTAKAEAGRLGGLASGVARRKHQGSNSEAEGQAEPKQIEARSVPVRPGPSSSSSSNGSSNGVAGHDDDDQVQFMKTIDILVECKARKHPPRDRDAWEPVTRSDLIAKKGDQVKAELAAGNTPLLAAAHITGSMAAAELAAGGLA